VIQDASWFLIEFFEEVLPVFLLFLRVTPAWLVIYYFWPFSKPFAERDTN
jgi:hypothetical protein